MAMYIYGLDPSTQQFKVLGPYSTEGQRSKYAGTLLDEGTVTLRTQNRIVAERLLKKFADEGKLRNFERIRQPVYEPEESSTGGGFFPKLRKWIEDRGTNKTENEWERD